MNTQTYANSPLKSCDTCIYQVGFCGDNKRCSRCGFFCEVQRMFASAHDSQCDANFSGWRPHPKRRSLRAWLYDTFLA